MMGSTPSQRMFAAGEAQRRSRCTLSRVYLNSRYLNRDVSENVEATTTGGFSAICG